MGLFVRWLLNAVALVVAAYLLDGIQIGSFGTALVAALVLGIVNAIIRPVFLLLTLPLNLLTLGLFTFVINGIMLMLAASLVGGFHIDGFFAALIGSVILSVTSWFLTSLIKDERH